MHPDNVPSNNESKSLPKESVTDRMEVSDVPVNDEDTNADDPTASSFGGVNEEPSIAEPDCSKANLLPFAILCKRLEFLWKERSNRSNKRSKDVLLQYLLPSSLHKYLAGGSPFPLFRLIMPEIDTSRPHSGMKEKLIATSWAEALGMLLIICLSLDSFISNANQSNSGTMHNFIGFNKGSSPYLKLTHYTDPTIAGMKAAGDLSVALKEVLEERFPYPPSKMTVGQINDLLDELANIRKPNNKAPPSSHTWRSSDNNNTPNKKQKKGYTKREQVRWVEKLIRNELSVRRKSTFINIVHDASIVSHYFLMIYIMCL